MDEMPKGAPADAPLPDTDALARVADELLAELGEAPAGAAPAAVAAEVADPDVEGVLAEILAGAPAADAAVMDPGGLLPLGEWLDDFARADAPMAYGERFYFLPEPVAQAPAPAPPPAPFDVEAVRGDFPILQERVNGKPLIWLDNAATTQKPRAVIDKLSDYYARYNSNVHRGAHALAKAATDAYEGARGIVQRFLGAASPAEIVWVRGATEAINLVAQSWGRTHLAAGDEILVSELEHHANIVPWQLLCRERGATLRMVPINDRGEVTVEEVAKKLGPKTRLLAIGHVSNVLGTVVPVKAIIQMAHAQGALVLVDGAQAVPHLPVNVQALDCDFYVFSGHKLFAPTGIGALYGKQSLLDEMPPWQGGGGMIEEVTIETTRFKPAPSKFEAGTGHIGGAVGLGAAIEYVQKLGLANVAAYESMLMAHASAALATVPGLRGFGAAEGKVGPLAFVLPGIDPEDVAAALDQEGIALRAGHHCAQPTMARFGVKSMVRPSIAFYNTKAEIDTLVEAVRKVQRSAAE